MAMSFDQPLFGTNTYNLNPGSRSGQGAYGAVPGVVDVPPSLYQGIGQIYPGLSQATGGASNVIRHELAGELSPETINNIQRQAATFGVAQGLPLTQFQGHRGLTMLGQNVEEQQRKGIEDYGKTLGTLSKLVTDPNLAASIAMWNAVNSAAPDPAKAAAAQAGLYEKYLNRALRAGQSPAAGLSLMGGLPDLGFGRGGGGGQSIFVGGPLGTDTSRDEAGGYQRWLDEVSSWNLGSPAAGSGTTRITQPGSWGDWSGINPDFYTYATESGLGGGGYDWAGMYEDAGLPFYDWSQVSGGTDSAGNTWDWSMFE